MKNSIYALVLILMTASCAHQQGGQKYAGEERSVTADRSRSIASSDERERYSVWLQFFTMPRDEAKEFGTALQALWPKTPGAEFGGERTELARNRREVLCHPRDKAAAEILTWDIARLTGVKMSPPVLDEKIPRGSLSVYFDARPKKIARVGREYPAGYEPNPCSKYDNDADGATCANLREQVRALKEKFNSELVQLCERESRQTICADITQRERLE